MKSRPSLKGDVKPSLQILTLFKYGYRWTGHKLTDASPSRWRGDVLVSVENEFFSARNFPVNLFMKNLSISRGAKPGTGFKLGVLFSPLFSST